MITYKKGIILVVILAIGAGLYNVCSVQKLCSAPSVLFGLNRSAISPTPTPDSASQRTLSLVEDGRLVLSSFSQLSFAPRSAQATWSNDNKDFLKQTADYINADTDRLLTVTGYYLSSEVSSTPAGFTDLGIARAAMIKDTLFQLGVTADRVILASSVLDDVSLSKSANFAIHVDKKNIPRTYTIQK